MPLSPQGPLPLLLEILHSECHLKVVDYINGGREKWKIVRSLWQLRGKVSPFLTCLS